MSSYRKRESTTQHEPESRSSLMCVAEGCPNRWTVSDQIGEGIRGKCSAHAWASPRLWGMVTQEQRTRAGIGPSAGQYAESELERVGR